MRFLVTAALGASLLLQGVGAALAADEPDLIFKKSTVWKFLTPDHTVQRTTFSNGVRVTVNFGEAAFTDGDGRRLEGMGYWVDE